MGLTIRYGSYLTLSENFPDMLRDWSLITGRGGYETGGGHRKFYPYEKGGGMEEQVLG